MWSIRSRVNGHTRQLYAGGRQAIQEPGVSFPRLVVPHCEAQCLLLSNDHQQTLSAGNSGVNQIALEQHVVLHGHWNDHSRKLRPLRLTDSDRASVHRAQHLDVADRIELMPFRDSVLYQLHQGRGDLDRRVALNEMEVGTWLSRP